MEYESRFAKSKPRLKWTWTTQSGDVPRYLDNNKQQRSKNNKQTAVIDITRQCHDVVKIIFMNLTFRIIEHTSSEVTVS